tara:strand:- start:29911 stop:32022 length:2112 start_codon:yes stop_codon:yes gene_type:complete
MADKKISEMTPMTAVQIANDDNIVIADTSDNHTKRAQISELATFFGVNTEGQQDLVADMFVNGSMTGISATYDDPNGVMNFSLAGGVTTAEMGYLAGTTSDIQTQLNSKSPIASPTFTGNPTAPTQSANDNSTKISTTAFVQGELTGYASDSATFTNKGGAISQWTNDSGYITPSSTSTLTNKSGSISQWTNNSGYITATSTDTLQNKTINGSDNTISNVPYSALTSIVDTDITSVSGSDDEIASSKAIKTYVDAQISGIDTIAEAGDTAITSPSSGQILVYDGSDSFDNKTASVTLTGAVTGTANMSSTGAVSVATTIPTNTITINGTAVALGGSATIPSVLQSGGTFTGELHLNDNVKLSLGGASGSGDLQIFHDGANSYISDTATGDLRIRGSSAIKLEDNNGSETFAIFNDDGAVDLYYDNVKKFETTSGGIDVTGNIVVSGTVDGRDVATDGTKLDGISSGAEVNVQANWTESSNTSDAFIQNKPSLSTVATSGSYNDLSNKPTIPTNNNQLSNGAGYITSVSGNISQLTNNSGYVTSSGVTSVATGNGLSGGTITSTGTLTMSGSYSGSFSSSGNLTAYSSDSRLKNFKGKIENALDKVHKLNGYYYEWNDTAKGIDADVFKDGVEVGVNAQEVMEVMPEVVTNAPIVDIHNLDTDYKTVYYDKLVPLLIESVKELKNRNEKLELIVNRLITEVEEK